MELIARAVGKLVLEAPVYGIVISYDWGNDILPPGISVGVESQRQQWISKHAKESVWYVWNPSEFKHGFIDCMSTPSDIAEMGRMITQLSSSLRRRKHAVSMLRRVARRLQAYDWTNVAPVTEDFLAISVDWELTELKQAMKASADAILLKRLTRKGLVP